MNENSQIINLDYEREDRCGVPEAVFAEFKSSAQGVEILEKLLAKSGYALFTRVKPEMRDALISAFPQCHRDDRGGTILFGESPKQIAKKKLPGSVLIAAAGVSDLAVVEEAALTLETAGVKVEKILDVGVAGLHRLLAAEEKLRAATVIIAVAGMEGALPSVIGGLVAAPVIAVPTSIGYGASFAGVTAMLAMLNSCAAGVAVMNIDNGYGAACLAIKILRQIKK